MLTKLPIDVDMLETNRETSGETSIVHYLCLTDELENVHKEYYVSLV